MSCLGQNEIWVGLLGFEYSTSGIVISAEGFVSHQLFYEEWRGTYTGAHMLQIWIAKIENTLLQWAVANFTIAGTGATTKLSIIIIKLAPMRLEN